MRAWDFLICGKTNATGCRRGGGEAFYLWVRVPRSNLFLSEASTTFFVLFYTTTPRRSSYYCYYYYCCYYRYIHVFAYEIAGSEPPPPPPPLWDPPLVSLGGVASVRRLWGHCVRSRLFYFFIYFFFRFVLIIFELFFFFFRYNFSLFYNNRFTLYAYRRR